MTTPDQPTQQQQAAPTTTTRETGMTIDVARLPIPGNAEFALYVLVVVIAWFVVWIDDDITAASWLEFFQWVTIGYLLSRGIAKASRVLEQ
jgi:hypothetical protein